MQSYSYNCVDRSILLPYFKKYYVAWFFLWVPKGLTANFITLFSTGFVAAMFLVAIYFPNLSSATMAAIFALCLHNYIVGDHLDGMQAKHTETSSPLGEFLDHYLDVYNGAILVYVLMVFFRPIPDEIFYLLLLLSCLVFAATMMEELERNELYFGPLGTLEAVIILIFFFISWLIPPFRHFWQQESLAGYPLYWLLIIFFALGYAATLFDIIRRLGYSPRQFNILIICALALSLVLYAKNVDRWLGWITLVLYSGEYVAKVMGSYLLSQKHKYPDIIASAGIMLLSYLTLTDLVTKNNFGLIFSFLPIYLACKVFYLFWSILYKLRRYWLWSNPLPQ